MTSTATSPAGTVARITKRCPGCGQTKPASEFNRAAARADGLQSRCRPCQRDAERVSRQRRQDRDRLAASSGATATAGGDDTTTAGKPKATRTLRRKRCATCSETKALRAFDHGAGTHGHDDTCRRCRRFVGAPIPVEPEQVEPAAAATTDGEFRRALVRSTYEVVAGLADRTGDPQAHGEAAGMKRAFEALTGEPIDGRADA